MNFRTRTCVEGLPLYTRKVWKICPASKDKRSGRDPFNLGSYSTLQKLKYDIHTKLPLESYQN